MTNGAECRHRRGIEFARAFKARQLNWQRDRLEPLHRNLSFLVLGAVLLVASIVFTRLRARIK